MNKSENSDGGEGRIKGTERKKTRMFRPSLNYQKIQENNYSVASIIVGNKHNQDHLNQSFFKLNFFYSANWTKYPDHKFTG